MSDPRQLGIPYQRHSRSSRAAARSIEPAAGTCQARVLAEVRLFPKFGLTDEEIQSRLGMSSSTERPRRVELVRLGLVRDSGFMRPTTSGRLAVLWIATEKAETAQDAPGATQRLLGG